MMNRLFPRQADNTFTGYRAALWILGLFLALKLAMSLNSMFNTATIVTNADGFPLESYGAAAARAVLMLFTLMSLGQLTLTVIAFTVLVRYRALVPFMYLVLLGEHIVRRLIVQGYAVARTGSTPVGWYVNYGLMALLALGLVLALIPRGDRK